MTDELIGNQQSAISNWQLAISGIDTRSPLAVPRPSEATARETQIRATAR
jgi:hypothetical protein